MRKLTLFSLVTLAIVFSLASITASAGEAQRIDVKRLTFEYRFGWGNTAFRVEAVDEAGAPVTFSGLGSYYVPFDDCAPCSIPFTFSTDSMHGFYLDFGQENHGEWQILSGHSEPLVLPPTIRRKPEHFSRTGTAEVHAKFAYKHQNEVLAYDDDVVLIGGYQADFGNANYLDGRKFNFYRIVYTLTQPAE
jgi:hypothetical protein